MMTKRIELSNAMVEIYYGETWREDKVYIYDPQLLLSEKDVASIIDYLYNEGFIQDHRVNYELIRIEY